MEFYEAINPAYQVVLFAGATFSVTPTIMGKSPQEKAITESSVGATFSVTRLPNYLNSDRVLNPVRCIRNFFGYPDNKGRTPKREPRKASSVAFIYTGYQPQHLTDSFV